MYRFLHGQIKLDIWECVSILVKVWTPLSSRTTTAPEYHEPFRTVDWYQCNINIGVVNILLYQDNAMHYIYEANYQQGVETMSSFLYGRIQSNLMLPK